MIPEPFRIGASRVGASRGWAVRTGLAAAVATAFLALPAESHAIFHWFSNCCGGSTTPTYGAAPSYGAASPADPCCAPPQVQTVNYVPQTCYRTQYVSVPVTTYRPVVGRDPCTGCPVTCMQPATSYVQQARLIPYTTYRPVLSNPCCGAATTGYVARYATYAPTASCGGCSGSAPPVTYAAPAAGTPYYGNPPFSGNTTSSATDAAAAAPTLAPERGSPGTPTFKQERQKPIRTLDDTEPKDGGSKDGADSETGKASGTGGTLSPRLFQPNDRTTSYPILRAGTRPVSYRETNRPATDSDGWRPSTR